MPCSKRYYIIVVTEIVYFTIQMKYANKILM